ncbi:MAG: SusC/RagA family TonB-linked outer membrane protein [Daejeonella sp.]
MKKLLQSLFLLLFIASQAIAQERTVTGTVTAQEDGLPLPGVSVKLVGTNLGTSTGTDGKFTFRVNASNPSLQFSFIGYRTQTVAVPASNQMNVSMVLDAKQLSEVVITTALGEVREKRSLGSSVQAVSGKDLTIGKSTDVSSSLAGKIAGVQLVGSPSSSFDNGNIIIRGINGLAPTVGGGSGIGSYGNSDGNPLFLVDGTPTDQSNVIMDNVENISVLKGAAATALYGNRASNGVVLITTKKGSRSGSPTVELNLGTTFENVSLLPSYQNEYAGGYTSAYGSKNTLGAGYLDDEGFYIFNYDPSIHPASWSAFNGQRILEYGADESWGPKINGQQYRPYYSWFDGAGFGQTEALTSQPNNIKDFFRTGTNLNNSIAVSGGGDAFTYRITYANQNRTLTLPTGDRNQNQIGLSGSYDISKRFTVMTDLNYTNNRTKGQPNEGYRNDGLNVTQNFNQWWQRQLNMDKLRDYRNPDGSLQSWNIGDPNATGDLGAITTPQYWDSPFFVANENYGIDKRNRLVGNLGFNFKLNDIFNVTSYARINKNNGEGDFRIPTGGLQQDFYSTQQFDNTETNYEAALNFKKVFNDISLNGFVGGNIRNNRLNQLYNATAGGLTFPNYFAIAGSVSRPTVTENYSAKKVRSVYGKATLGYKGFLYLDATIRNDWSSALPVTDNSYLYPSVSTSFVFSELMGASNLKNILTFGKLRASYAQVGSDLNFNQVNIAVNNGSIFDGNPSAAVGNQFRTGLVKPALTKSYELGTELRFFNKIGLDFTYYHDDNINQILSLDVAPASGFTSSQINAGNIQRKGYELSLNGSPIARPNFSWDVTLNLAHSTSIVKELADGLTTYLYGTTRSDTRIENRVGEKWGMLVGRNWKTDAEGRTVFASSNGTVDYTLNNEIGSVLPDMTGGMYNTLRYKGVDLSFSIDFQKGGRFFSQTKYFNMGTGLSKYTTGVNDLGNDIRDFPAAGGGVRMDGVTAAGAPLTVYVPARRYFYTNLQRDSRNFVLDGSYLKLREVRLGYTIPKSLLGNTPVKTANLGFIVGNAWLIAAPSKKWGIDPSELENFWTEGGQLSSTRQLGLNLKMSF